MRAFRSVCSNRCLVLCPFMCLFLSLFMHLSLSQERVVHARGSGAHGTFTCMRAMTEFTSAALLQREGLQCDAFVRFSQAVGNRGSPDTSRDVRGFALKLYTTEGNWDLVCNNFAVFIIRDGIKFPDFAHATRPESDSGIPNDSSAHSTFWDWVASSPETHHHVLWQMSDRGIVRSYRMMEGFSSAPFFSLMLLSLWSF